MASRLDHAVRLLAVSWFASLSLWIPGAQAQQAGPPELGTVFLGFCPTLPGSSAQIDLGLTGRLIRLTARTSSPSSEFEDFHIDVPPVPTVTWQRTVSGGADRLVFRYVDSARNLQIAGDFLLSPHWRGTLDTAPIDARRPMDNLPASSGRLRWLMVRAPWLGSGPGSSDMRAMPFGVFKTVNPVVSIPIGVVTSSQGRVYLDDGWNSTPDAIDVTGYFVPVGTEAVATSMLFRYGTNRLTFVFPQGSFESHSQNCDPETPALLEEEIVNETSDYIEADYQGDRVTTLDNGLGVFVFEDQPDDVTSAFFRQYRFRPVTYAKEFFFHTVLVHGQDLSDDENGNNVADVLEYPEGPLSFDSRQAHLIPEVAVKPAYASELIPTANANNNATLGYNVANHAWNDPAPPPVGGRSLLKEHFWMDTFAGHRLIQAFGQGPGAPALSSVTVGVIDSGFGEGDAFSNADMPLGAFRDLWVLPGNNDARPLRLNETGGARVNVTDAHLQDNFIFDEIDGGHGTPVAHLVGGRGALQKLGTGPNALVTIGRQKGLGLTGVATGADYAVLSQVIQDPQLRLLNLSKGVYIRFGIAASLQRSSEYVYDRLAARGIGAVVAAGNNDDQPNETAPATVSPPRGQRHVANSNFVSFKNLGNADQMSPLMMRVSAFTVPDAGNAQESFWNPPPPPPAGVRPSGSGFGNNISVTAAGDNLQSIEPQGVATGPIVGTSFATPLVTGLLSEVLRLLDMRAAEGPPATLGQRTARAGRVMQAIEIVEATADRLNRNIQGDFDQAEPPADNQQGFGRINVFKAALSAINGGLAEGGTVKSAAAPNQFNSLATVNAGNTARYGFLMRLQSNQIAVANRFSNATVWLNTNPYDDTITPAANLAARLNDAGANTEFTGADGGAATNNVIAYKRLVDLDSRLPVGFETAGGAATGTGVQEMVFSAQRTEISGAGGQRRLELRQNGDAAGAPPFFAILLDLATLRNNAGNGENVRFDDFVLEILVDHFVTFSVSEVVVGAGAGALQAADEKPLTVTVFDRNGNGVSGVPVKFSVVTNAGAESGATQIRLRTGQGVAGEATNQTINSSAEAATLGQSTVWVTRIAAGANNAAPQGVTSRIRVEVPINSGGGAAVGAQYPQDYTIPTR